MNATQKAQNDAISNVKFQNFLWMRHSPYTNPTPKEHPLPTSYFPRRLRRLDFEAFGVEPSAPWMCVVGIRSILRSCLIGVAVPQAYYKIYFLDGIEGHKFANILC